MRHLTHMGRDIQAELTLSSDELVVAQLPRERIDCQQLKVGEQLHITSREARTFAQDCLLKVKITPLSFAICRQDV